MRATLGAVTQDQPDEARPPALRASDADRERVAGVLHRALSEGRITMTELEERLGAVYAARTHAELAPLTADLPNALAPAPGTAVGHPLVGGTPGSTFSMAVMSSAARTGNWCVPAQHTSFAFCGGVEIDLRQATFAERHVTITAVAIMGGIEIVVPDDIRVEVTGFGLMGGFDSKGDAQREPDPAGPVVTVNGFAFWGGVMVKRRPRTPPPDKHRMI